MYGVLIFLHLLVAVVLVLVVLVQQPQKGGMASIIGGGETIFGGGGAAPFMARLTTGLAIASHTTQGVTALQELDVLAEVGVPASRFIWVHADAEPNQDLHFRAAARGAWIEYDGIREANADQRLPLVLAALDRLPDQLLLSQDAGWYHVGEPNGGEIAPFDWLPKQFAPRLQEAQRLLVANPAKAFRIGG